MVDDCDSKGAVVRWVHKCTYLAGKTSRLSVREIG